MLTLLSNALTVQLAAQGPELMALYRMDNFHVWKLLFGLFAGVRALAGMAAAQGRG